MGAQEVRIPRQGGEIGGLLAVPDGPGPFPGIIMAPTIFRLDRFARYVVERLAEDSFVALAVDVFDHPGVPEDPFRRPGSLPDEQLMADLEAGLALLRAHPQVQERPVAVWGYCFGGRLALLWPTYRKGLAAAAAFHPFPRNDTSNPNTPAEPLGRVAHLSAPLIACFGEADSLVPLEHVYAYREALAADRKDFEVHIYPGAEHSWTNPMSPHYLEWAAEDCWRRAVGFIRRRIAAQEDART